VGNPQQAEVVIAGGGSVGAPLGLPEVDPDTPEGRMGRYVVIRYPAETDFEAIAAELRNSPHVEHVERNRAIVISSPALAGLPSDPLLGPVSADPLDFQWGSHTLNLPAAWDLIQGHALLGLLDLGLEPDHPDLRALSEGPGGDLVVDGGNFRQHRSQDVFFNDCNVDELDPADDGQNNVNAGHGTHVAGIAAATTDNGQGVAGACPHCSLHMIKVFSRTSGDTTRVARGLDVLLEQGTQIVSMSFGLDEPPCQGLDDLRLLCQFIAAAERRDLLMLASSGNDRAGVEFPANTEAVVAVGGLSYEVGGSHFWDFCPSGDLGDPGCACPFSGFFECGSNRGPEQELVGPAEVVLSTAYTGTDHSPAVGCGDNFLPGVDGYGPCTGTSMSSPYIAGVAGLVRSANPLLRNEEVRDILIATASKAGVHDEQLGYGVPDAEAAVQKALGVVAGQTLANRLTPLFSLYTAGDQTHAFVTAPTMATALIFDVDSAFTPTGPNISGYPSFPGAECVVSPCSTQPAASAYIFTTDQPPFVGAPPLVPLYRLLYDPNLPTRCLVEPPPHQPLRDFSYTTTEQGILHFKKNTVDAAGVGYDLEGIEGYIYERCEPEPACIPSGAERLYRLYHPLRDDYVVFPESELPQWQGDGYVEQAGLNSWIGYAYPAVDGDGDQLIDGFELLIGTDPALADSDCDGVFDGVELLRYDETLHRYGDPLSASQCPSIFSDGFENGNTSNWTLSIGL